MVDPDGKVQVTVKSPESRVLTVYEGRLQTTLVVFICITVLFVVGIGSYVVWNHVWPGGLPTMFNGTAVANNNSGCMAALDGEIRAGHITQQTAREHCSR